MIRSLIDLDSFFIGVLNTDLCMKRKTFLIQILVLLFTFQNIWSVAEAACLHEMPNIPNSILSNPIDLDEKSDSPRQALYSLENGFVAQTYL